MRRVFALAASLLFAILAPGCNDESGPSDGVGRIQIHLSDAPYPFDLISSAEMTIEGVEVHIADSGFHTLAVVDPTASVNLLDLQNGVTLLVVDTEVPVGNVDQIRLIVRDASVTLTDGRTFDLVVPSGESSGLKLFVDPPIEVVSGLTTDVLLDVDVSRSFQAVPNAARQAEDIRLFHFHPVLRVANLTTAGTVKGAVWSDAGTPADLTDDTPIAGATVTVSNAGTDFTTTSTTAAGTYAIPGLPAGGYSLRAEAAGFTTAEAPVTITAGNAAEVVFRLSPTS